VHKVAVSKAYSEILF